MWTCNICGNEYASVFDADHCGCLADPELVGAARRARIRRLASHVLRLLLGPIIGIALGAVLGPIVGIYSLTLEEGIGVGGFVGGAVGILWSASYLTPFQDPLLKNRQNEP